MRTVCRMLLGCVAALAVGAGAAVAAIKPLPPPLYAVVGKTATVSLPYRTSDHLIWVSATRMLEAEPWVFAGLEIKPGKGPNGTDLSVFTYKAEKAGSSVLKFGLVPPGKMLIGLPSMVYTGPVEARWETKVSTQ
jgi:hypothetical protein